MPAIRYAMKANLELVWEALASGELSTEASKEADHSLRIMEKAFANKKGLMLMKAMRRAESEPCGH